jgi:hypothetical protein
MSAVTAAKFENPPNMDDVALPFFVELRPKEGGLLYPHLRREGKREGT